MRPKYMTTADLLKNEKELKKLYDIHNKYYLFLTDSPSFKNKVAADFNVLYLYIICENNFFVFELHGRVRHNSQEIKINATFPVDNIDTLWRVYALRLLRAMESLTLPVLGSEEQAFPWKG